MDAAIFFVYNQPRRQGLVPPCSMRLSLSPCRRRGAVFLSPVLAGLSLEAPKALGGFRHGRVCPTQSRRRRAPVFYVPADAAPSGEVIA